MSAFKNAYLEHQIKRWMASNAHHFVRPDWRRHVQPGSDLASVFELYERKYSPDQPRVPAGSHEGGQWTNDGSASGASRNETTELSAQSRQRGKGHHELPQALYRNLPLPEETRKVFDKATTGPIPSRGHQWDNTHREYNDAVRKLMNDFMAENNIQPEQMTPEQAQSLLKAVRESPEPRISNYNKGIRMLQFLYRVRTGVFQGNE